MLPTRLQFSLLLLGSTLTMFNKESPVIWRPADSAVIREVKNITQTILYLSPCYLITNTTVYGINVESLKE